MVITPTSSRRKKQLDKELYDAAKRSKTLTLAKQSTLKAHVIEITKACIAAFMKARNSLVV